MNKIRSTAFLAVFCILFVGLGLSQVSTGTPPFGSFGGGSFDTINLGNLNVHFEVPVFSRAGRGIPFSYTLSYDNSVFYPSGSVGAETWQPVPNWGWRGQTEVAIGYISYNSSETKCYDDPSGFYWGTRVSSFVYHDNFGVGHYFPIAPFNICETPRTTDHAYASDGSGIYYDADGNGIILPGGHTISPPTDPNGSYGTATDTNGNYLSVSGGTFTDTLGTTALTVSGSPNPTSFNYTTPDGATTHGVSISYTSYNIWTNFGCLDSGSHAIAEYSASAVPLVDTITLPDGSTYTFSYETNSSHSSYKTGRLASVTLPTGGTISYTYTDTGVTNDGVSCTDGSSVYLKKQTPDTGSSSWTYSRALSSGIWQTTQEDPAGNYTLLSFQFYSTSGDFYETKRQVYNGSISSSNLLQTVDTCYNASSPNGSGDCTANTVSATITQVDSYRRLPNLASGVSSRTVNQYDSTYTRLTETDEYDFGAVAAAYGSLLRKTIRSYASFTNGIINRPYQISVYDGGGTLKAQTTYSYDGGSLTTPSGTTPHWYSVSGSRGNPTQITYLVGGTSTLSRSFSYYNNGGVRSFTDVNGAATTYQLGTSTTANCGNSFPVEVDQPLSLTGYMTWDCNGGVQKNSTDPSGNPTSVTYYDASNTPTFDPLWRPIYSTDALGNKTYSYYTATTSESKLAFNSGSSVVDQFVTFDSTGRTHVAQTKQGPSLSTYDSVETDYDASGRGYRTTLPYQGTSVGQTATSPQYTTTTFDSAGRPLQVTDAASGYTSSAYNSGSTSYYNDVLTTVGPAPTGENLKKRQLEYDGLGHLTSVCELTSATGSGTCGQNTSQTGFWTKYTYNVFDQIVSVTQNAQSGTTQTRSFSYDGLGRLTSETNPENGTTTYTYDSSGASLCNSGQTSLGDLVLKVDANGTNVCYYYDSLHRIAAVGTNRSVDQCKRFLYDNSTGILGSRPSGVTVNNSYGRLVEAETDTCAWPVTSTSMISDEWFSYSARGELTDVYESTPHSGGYYHVSASYWAHGALDQLSGIPDVPTLYYGGSTGTGLDGEGRVTAVTASSGTNPVSSVLYDSSVGTLTKVTYGSSDYDSMTYDPYTLRLSNYTATVGATPQTDAHTLTWNISGSLQQLAISDGLTGSADSQTCNYTHDDLGRIKKVDCGTKWEQDFTPDVFGNIYKTTTGTGQAFTPVYGTSTNRISSGYSVTYDSNGNLTNDGLSPTSYTWNVDNTPVTITRGSTTITVIYDAQGRAVENQNGSSYTEILYGPGGNKLALMNGASTLVKAFIPLPGGGQAAYNSLGLAYYRHGDWLGSSRLATTPSRTSYFNGSYAPFGEDYAGTGTTDLSFTGQNQDTISGLYDFMYRRYNPVQGRWISTDPAGLSAVNPANPQTWNRYAYVANGPLNATDSLGLLMSIGCTPFTCSDGGGGYTDDGYCPPEYEYCGDPYDPGSGPDPGGEPGGGGAGRGPSTPTRSPQWGKGSWANGGSDGIPNGFPWGKGSIWGAFLPIDPSCEFGPCVSIANSLIGADDAAEAALCVAQPELCVAALITIYVAVRYGPQIIHAAKDAVDWTSNYSKCLNDFIEDSKACTEAYPPGPALENCYKAARQKFDLCKASGAIQ